MDTSLQNSFSVNNPEMLPKDRNSCICRIRFCRFLFCGFTKKFSA